MSWHLNVQGTKDELQDLIQNGELSREKGHDEEPAEEPQVKAAKAVALQLVEHVDGPKLVVSLNGHSNGMGEKLKPGMSNNYINVTVSQSLN